MFEKWKEEDNMFKSLRHQKREELKETSVLNTDAFDKRRFEQIFGMSERLQSIEELAKVKSLPMFKGLLGDMWAGLFKLSPELKEDVPEHLEANHSIMNKIMSEESFQGIREKSKLDDMFSAIGAVRFGEETYHWLMEQKRRNEELSMAMEEAQKQLEHSRQDSDESDEGEQGSGGGGNEDALNQAMSEFAQQMGEALEQSQNSFSRMVANAIEETRETEQNLNAMIGGIEAGTGTSKELNKVPLRDKIKLAEVISTDPDMKEIAEWVGRFAKIARTKQKMKHKDSTEQSGVEQGNDLARVLPSGLVQYTNPATKNDFLKRFAEGQLMQYEQKGKESLGQGSIILCLDQSGSMKDLDNQAKAFAIALMAIAKRQKRNFVYIPFNWNVGNVRTFPKGKITPSEIVEIAREFMGGGTVFTDPLKTALNYIKMDRYKDADVIFVTDGEAGIGEAFLERLNVEKEKLKFNVLSLAIGSMAQVNTLELFSDRVVKIKTFDEDGAFEAFEV
ncbi:hypothetical protein [Pueribacillus sp. YX66]|uniref:vWA domain-containing protein n=1 Tax=Pueribacillus sp. YX66 TaxID=3229242 RepID=UPI00358D4A0A